MLSNLSHNLIYRVFAQVLELVQVFGGEESDNVVETNIDEEDQFDWLWHPMCDVPVHVSLACIQVMTVMY